MSRRLVFSTVTPRHRHPLSSCSARSTRGAATRRSRASYDAKLDAIRTEVRTRAGQDGPTSRRPPAPAARRRRDDRRRAGGGSRARMVAEIKEQLQTEMGLLPVTCCAIADRASSSCTPTTTRARPTTAPPGYLGGGYFITVKHAVVALHDEDDRPSARKILSVKVIYQRQGNSREGDRHRRRRRRGAQRRLGDHQDRAIWICRRCASTRRSRTTSPIRSSASATTTRRGSSSRPATSASARRTAW